ncbi:protein-disulfide reductase DsbD [Paraglaciecola hydrolytica]|uniref:Thiol:disulfide interchange protein DsbD n=1 Tax=Paraglaciecola hydrolytica TaxID=1799789 RepID=A0A136A514_9ALTE|nr:protein-disulfide reductase DsbD [Paraglaciecola hydrolytica]KXI30332.1 protein-disulfide reductase DsbD [Paraglaciecola hydrolytica]
MKLIRPLLILLALFTTLTSIAQQGDPFSELFAEEPEFLPVDEAFQFDFKQHNNELVLSWTVAEGYYLYKKQFKTVVKNAELAEPTYPVSEQIEDEFFGLSDIFRQQVAITYPIIHSVQDGVVKIQYQGCADAGLCYPPTIKVVYLNEVAGLQTPPPAEPIIPTATADVPVSQQFELADLLTSEQSLMWTLLLFLGLGIGLAFTPCVFPMYPILSGIVIGQGKGISSSRAFSLSFIYVQGMALTYSLLGLIVASAGVQFQASLQHPAILISLIVIFVLLAVVMFGAYELQMPSSWQEKLNSMSNQQKSGSYIGVFVMGAISGLVASPCTTAPLTGILLFIAQSGDLLLGFSALYALSLGMGIPLILFGITGGKLLPKAGNWMNIVKVTFGFMMLAVALMFVERLVSHFATDIAWALLGLCAFSYFYVMNANSKTSFFKGLRVMLIFIGLLASALYGYSSIAPLVSVASVTSTIHQQSANSEHPDFMLVKSIEDFEQKLAKANAEGKTVMVDLYADWCVACKEFEKYTFPDPAVIEALGNTEWMQIDLTDNTPVNLAFQEHFAVLGLPTILFFDKQGAELKSARVTGFMQARPFAEHVKGIFQR